MKAEQVTKRSVDELARLKLDYQMKKAEADKAEKLYKLALEPISSFVESTAGETQEVTLTGLQFMVDFGPRRSLRVVDDQVQALLALEKVEKGLGYASISIPLKVLDDNLRASDVEHLCHIEYGSRNVKVTKL